MEKISENKQPQNFSCIRVRVFIGWSRGEIDFESLELFSISESAYGLINCRRICQLIVHDPLCPGDSCFRHGIIETNNRMCRSDHASFWFLLYSLLVGADGDGDEDGYVNVSGVDVVVAYSIQSKRSVSIPLGWHMKMNQYFMPNSART